MRVRDKMWSINQLMYEWQNNGVQCFVGKCNDVKEERFELRGEKIGKKQTKKTKKNYKTCPSNVLRGRRFYQEIINDSGKAYRYLI